MDMEGRSGGWRLRWREEYNIYMMSRVGWGMLLVQIFGTGLQLLSKIILNQGTFVFALMTYRHLVAALCVSPFALYFDRGNIKKLTWSAFFWLFITALTGISMAMGFFYFGLRDTTATYATNFLALIPIATFIFSTVLRIEKVGLGTKAGKMKTTGAILCLVGALIISLYKGRAFHLSSTRHQSISRRRNIIIKTTSSSTHQIRGTLFLVASIVSYGFWFIVQVKLFKVFPYKYLATLLICVIASLQQLAIGLCMDSSKKSWMLEWNLELVTIIYSGALATAATFCLIQWGIAKRGPTYPSMFNPISLILVAITGTLFLGEDITVGSLLGMSIIIVGLYSFLWAKNKEMKSILNTTTTTPSSGKTTLQEQLVKAAADDELSAETKLAIPANQSSSSAAAPKMMQLTAIVVPSDHLSPSNDDNRRYHTN